MYNIPMDRMIDPDAVSNDTHAGSDLARQREYPMADPGIMISRLQIHIGFCTPKRPRALVTSSILVSPWKSGSNCEPPLMNEDNIFAFVTMTLSKL